MQKKSVSRGFKSFCLLSLVCVNGIIVTEASSQANPFPLDAQLRYNGSGAGIDGNTSVGLRIPLNQTPDNFFYVTPQVRVFNNGKIGSNLIVGYRSLDEAAKHILGGYFAYDNRDTGAQFFQQISAGLEFFAEAFDLRLNAYMPVGQSTVQLGESLLGTGRFIGNQFGVDRDRRIDAAMGGMDVEAGTIVNIEGINGYLRPYAGTYFYTASNSAGALGIRGGLGYYGSLINAGISVQNDRVFGTSILFNIGINLGNSPSSKPPTLLERMNESVARNGSVMIENQVVRDQVIAINPATGRPYSIFVVSDNTSGLVGNPNVVTFANFATAVANAGAAGSDGIVFAYAPAGSTAPTISGFTIPDQVRVISSAPSTINLAYTAAGTTFSSIPLPSNTGVFPIVTDTVTLASGSNQALIGFAINKNVATGAGAGIIGNNNTNATIASNIVTITAPSTTGVGTSGRGIVLVGASGNTNVLNNQVNNAIAEGIRLDNVSGTAAITGNTVTNTIQPNVQTQVEAGILVRNNTGNVNLTIANNTVGNNTTTGGVVEVDGIEFSLCRVYPDLAGCTTTTTATVNITGNTIRNITGATDGADGIDINLGNNANATLTISNNTIDNIVNKGISFGAVDGSIGTTTISNNNISNVGGAAIQVRVGETAVGGQSSVRAAVLNNKVTNTNTQVGIDDASMIIRSQNAASLCVRFEGNTLNNPTSSLDYLFRRQSTSASGLQLAGLTTAIAVANPSPTLVTELTARGNTGGVLAKYRVQNNTVQIPTAACTFP